MERKEFNSLNEAALQVQLGEAHKKSTLGTYINTAAGDMADARSHGDYLDAEGSGKDVEKRIAAERHRESKRKKGIKQATARLSDGGESVDEGSSTHDMIRFMEVGRQAKAKRKAEYDAMTPAEQEKHNEEEYRDHRDKMQKMSQESVEHLDEIDREKLKTYLDTEVTRVTHGDKKHTPRTNRLAKLLSKMRGNQQESVEHLDEYGVHTQRPGTPQTPSGGKYATKLPSSAEGRPEKQKQIIRDAIAKNAEPRKQKLPRQLKDKKSEMLVTSPKGKTFVIYKSQWKDHEASGHIVAEGVELGESTDSRELHLFTSNHPDIHRQRTNPVHKNLRNKMARGTYDTTKAHKAFMHVAKDGSKAYDKAHGHKFDKDAIHKTATAMQNEFESEAKDGHHDHHLYKKYRNKKQESVEVDEAISDSSRKVLEIVAKNGKKYPEQSARAREILQRIDSEKSIRKSTGNIK